MDSKTVKQHCLSGKMSLFPKKWSIPLSISTSFTKAYNTNGDTGLTVLCLS